MWYGWITGISDIKTCKYIDMKNKMELSNVWRFTRTSIKRVVCTSPGVNQNADHPCLGCSSPNTWGLSLVSLLRSKHEAFPFHLVQVLVAACRPSCVANGYASSSSSFLFHPLRFYSFFILLPPPSPLPLLFLLYIRNTNKYWCVPCVGTQ